MGNRGPLRPRSSAVEIAKSAQETLRAGSVQSGAPDVKRATRSRVIFALERDDGDHHVAIDTTLASKRLGSCHQPGMLGAGTLHRDAPSMSTLSGQRGRTCVRSTAGLRTRSTALLVRKA